jgi:hypothetical protein
VKTVKTITNIEIKQSSDSTETLGTES